VNVFDACHKLGVDVLFAKAPAVFEGLAETFITSRRTTDPSPRKFSRHRSVSSILTSA